MELELELDAYDWSDVSPIQQDDGPNSLATIAYTDEYRKATGLLRALMLKEEVSKRALAVVEDVIASNPAHYTAWYYRLKIIKALGSEIIPKEHWLLQDEPCVHEDREWIDTVTMDNSKNYQVWHYRQCLEVANKKYYRAELVLVKMILEEECKNYHAWAHYKWLVQNRLDIFPLEEQIDYVNELIDDDVRNNSAWCFKFFLYGQADTLKNEDAFAAEQEFVEAKIALAPQNESAWNYLTGLHDKYKGNRDGLEALCLAYTEPELQSTHALEVLQGIYSESKPLKSIEILDTLESYLPIRKGYWNFLRGQISKNWHWIYFAIMLWIQFALVYLSLSSISTCFVVFGFLMLPCSWQERISAEDIIELGLLIPIAGYSFVRLIVLLVKVTAPYIRKALIETVQRVPDLEMTIACLDNVDEYLDRAGVYAHASTVIKRNEPIDNKLPEFMRGEWISKKLMDLKEDKSPNATIACRAPGSPSPLSTVHYAYAAAR